MIGSAWRAADDERLPNARGAGRGVTKLTSRGEAVLGEAPVGIDIEFLKQFAEFQDFLARKGTRRPQREGGTGSHEERLSRDVGDGPGDGPGAACGPGRATGNVDQ